MEECTILKITLRVPSFARLGLWSSIRIGWCWSWGWGWGSKYIYIYRKKPKILSRVNLAFDSFVRDIVIHWVQPWIKKSPFLPNSIMCKPKMLEYVVKDNKQRCFLIRRTMILQHNEGLIRAPNDRLPDVLDINWINIQDQEPFWTTPWTKSTGMSCWTERSV